MINKSFNYTSWFSNNWILLIIIIEIMHKVLELHIPSRSFLYFLMLDCKSLFHWLVLMAHFIYWDSFYVSYFICNVEIIIFGHRTLLFGTVKNVGCEWLFCIVRFDVLFFPGVHSFRWAQGRSDRSRHTNFRGDPQESRKKVPFWLPGSNVLFQ